MEAVAHVRGQFAHGHRLSLAQFGLMTHIAAAGDDGEPGIAHALGAVIDAHHPGLLEGNLRAFAAGRDAVRELAPMGV